MKTYFKTDAGKKAVLAAYREILSQWPVRNRQYNVDTSFGSTFVIESGEKGKPPVLLLHGSVSNSFAWFGDVRALSEDFHVFSVDMIGEAELSAEVRPSYESGAYAEWLHEVLGSLQLDAAALVGLSLGGWMALEYACTYPQEVSGLFLLCPGGLYAERKSFLWKVIFYSFFGKWGKKKMTALLLGRDISRKEAPEGLERAMEFSGLIGRHFKPRMGSLPVFSPKRLANLAMPVQVLYGEHDAVLKGGESLNAIKAAVPHSHGHIVAGMGHVLVGQTGRMIDFLKTIGGKHEIDTA